MNYENFASTNTSVDSIKELANKVVVSFDKNILSRLKGKELFAALTPHKDVRIVAKDGFYLEIDKKEKYSIRRIRDMIAIVNENMEVADE